MWATSHANVSRGSAFIHPVGMACRSTTEFGNSYFLTVYPSVVKKTSHAAATTDAQMKRGFENSGQSKSKIQEAISSTFVSLRIRPSVRASSRGSPPKTMSRRRPLANRKIVGPTGEGVAATARTRLISSSESKWDSWRRWTLQPSRVSESAI